MAVDLKEIQRSDLLLASFVLAITAMLLLPLPTALLDVLLVTNLAFSLLLLLVGLYLPNALALLAFPALLLLSTLFRVGLNVASTRLILSMGEAGEVIRAFGTFLISGQIVVGVIIFLIITVVNFVVVARGASRVSEVAARFALDALPGKQMAIDAEMRAGVLSAEEAHRKREELRKESQLYGAMDGAMKFVQGDVIAGLFIIATNIIGGIYIGLQEGMSIAGAVETYTRLTVGDGLVSQIPALFISICAGIVVTRVSSGESATLGGDVGEQLFTRPSILFFLGGMVICLGLAPGLPITPFTLVGVGLLVIGATTRRSAEKRRSTRAEAGDHAVALAPGEESAGGEAPLILALDARELFRLFNERRSQYERWWELFRHDYYLETGLQLPDMLVGSDESLAPGEFAFLARGALVEQAAVDSRAVLVEMNPDSATCAGFDIGAEAAHPVTGSRAFWTTLLPSVEAVSAEAGVRLYGWFEFVGLKIGAFYQHNPEEILPLTDVHSRLKQFEKRHSGLISETLGESAVSAARVTSALHALARERVSVRDVKGILEAIAAYAAAFRSKGYQEDEFDIEDLVAYVRQGSRRVVMRRYLTERHTLKTVTLSSRVEELFEETLAKTGVDAFALDPTLVEELSAKLEAAVAPTLRRGIPPLVVACRADLRAIVSAFLYRGAYPVDALAINEIDPHIAVEPVAVWQ